MVKMKILLNILKSSLILMLLTLSLYSNDLLNYQEDSLLYTNKLLNLPINHFQTNFSKFSNIFTLINSVYYQQTNDFGTFELSQNYQGSSLKIEGNPFRDDEVWNFEYEKPIFYNFNFIFQNNWIFSSDSRNIGINQLMRLNGAAGLKYIYQNIFTVSGLYGIEDNNQLNLRSNGKLISFNSLVNNLNYENVNIYSQINGNFLSLNENRKNNDIFAFFKIFKDFNDSTNYNVDILYKNLQNNLLSYSFQADILPIEMRDETDLVANLNINYQIMPKINIYTNINLNTINVSRQYQNYLADIPYSSYIRQAQQFELDINSGTSFQIGKLYQNFELNGSSRNESNLLYQNFPSNSSDFEKYQSIESQRDNNSSKLNFLSNTKFQINSKSFFMGIYNVQIFKYDTPSQLNYDDRDEFNSILNLKYYHEFSENLNFAVDFENDKAHTVYIFSERSSLNNWNIIYRFSPQIHFNLNGFSMNPKAEVLANYTIYDYENNYSSLKSISFRQISYLDSIRIALSALIVSENNLSFKYSTRSILYWHDFSESPQNGIYEIYINSILKRNFSQDVSVGAGCKYFNYFQTTLFNNSNNYQLKSFAPEIIINYVYKNYNFNLNGWYEFQTINQGTKREVANLSILVNINL